MTTSDAPFLVDLDEENQRNNRDLTVHDPDINSSQFIDDGSDPEDPRNRRSFFGLFKMTTQITITNATTSVTNITVPISLLPISGTNGESFVTIQTLACLPSGLVIC